MPTKDCCFTVEISSLRMTLGRNGIGMLQRPKISNAFSETTVVMSKQLNAGAGIPPLIYREGSSDSNSLLAVGSCTVKENIF